MTAQVPLAAIVALARSGAVERAWSLFAASGRADAADDPAALTVRGRLEKARAGAAALPSERKAGHARAAAAYAAAHALDPQPYLAINVATCATLAGDGGGGKDWAQRVLSALAGPEAVADTPYFVAATRAEALLLLGNLPAASAALAEAIAHGADNWDDRAVTIAQLDAISAHLALPGDWLDPFRLPASLHFAGHMGLLSGGPGEARLRAAVRELVEVRAIGFGYGALAAGADIIIAETLLHAGKEVHAVLPCPPDAFAAQSVAPAGEVWTARYHAVLDRVSSLSHGPGAGGTRHDPLASALAGELAMGKATLHARRLATQSWQLVVLDQQGGGPNTAALAERWPHPAHAIRLAMARECDAHARFGPDATDPAWRDVTLLSIRTDHTPLGPDTAPASSPLAALAGCVAEALAGLPPARVRVGAGRWDIIADTPAQAAGWALAVLAATATAGDQVPPVGPGSALASGLAFGLAFGLARGIATLVADPLTGAIVPYGPLPARAQRLAAQAPPGIILADELTAIALTLPEPALLQGSRGSQGPQGPRAGSARCEPFIDDDPDVGGPAYLVLPA